jgi:serine/threonine-protein kinase
VVTVHDYGEQDGTPYIVMELLDGETLADRLGGGPLSPAAAATVCAQIAAALAAAHEAGLVHRDVKPANVFLTRDGVKVLDFGVAVRGESGPALGTPAYLAPEQLAHGPVTPAADVFALGVVLFEALAGRRPFGEDDARTDPPPFPAGTPAEVAELGGRCLAVDPAARPTAADVNDALAGFAADTGFAAGNTAASATEAQVGAAPGDRRARAAARPRTSVLADPFGQRRRKLLTSAGVAAAIVIVIAFALANRDPGRPATAAPPASSPSATAPSAARSTPTGSSAPAGPTLEALTRMRHSVDEGAAAGQVRPDVAVDFDNLISQLQDRLTTGEPIDVGSQVGQLRVKIDQRLREGGLTADRAQDLRAALAGI